MEDQRTDREGGWGWRGKGCLIAVFIAGVLIAYAVGYGVGALSEKAMWAEESHEREKELKDRYENKRIGIVEQIISHYLDYRYRRMMFNWFKRRPDPIVEAAVASFSASNDNFVIRGFCRVCDEVDNGFIVRVCYDEIKPPRRTWFFVSSDASNVTRLSDVESEPYRKGPWR